ncbi:MAG TPA: Stp1/IreP family PP2C-type Ser/Thr phosphatase [Aquabacterium sp.]|nr:Stp1/IreP family PP2C-type Ser/Thr phosphatase [Aquabacterium sp.]HRH28487.1 Stp1/IreP family PP2C-type Ser/Thr phosphatase [Aquabacterium sp.]
MDFEFFSQTDTGRIRNNNEDSVAMDPAAGVAVLADGMGGYNAGEVASQMACDFILGEMVRWLFEASKSATDADVKRAMDICVDNANRAIFTAANSNPTFAGMGTTLVVTVVRPGRVLIGHIGDSRAYRLREGRLQQVTKDHSLLQEQIDAGILTPEQAAVSANKNLVTRAVGVEDFVLLETRVHDVQDGDTLLMCSDGLSDMIQDREIEEIMGSTSDLSDMAARLISAANASGGRDNIAVMLIRAHGASEPAPRAWWPFRRLGNST